MRAFNISFMSGNPGWATMERLPSARGPIPFFPETSPQHCLQQPAPQPPQAGVAAPACDSPGLPSSALIRSAHRKTRAQIRILHLIATRLFESRMIGVQGGANRQSFIAGRGLDPCLSKRSFHKELSVGDAIQCTAPCHGQVWQRNPLVQSLSR